MLSASDYQSMLNVALSEAKLGFKKVASPSEPRYSIPPAICSARATIAASSKMIHPSMLKPMLFAKQAASAATATSSWSPLLLLAGIAAVWFDNLVFAFWSLAKAGIFKAALIGYVLSG